MRFYLIFILIAFSSSASLSQNQGNIWLFGDGNGLDFSSGTPVTINGGSVGSSIQEGTAVISDSAAHLLLYTGGQTIWNRNHQPLPNGTNINGGISGTQNSIIVPLPGSDSLFYVFTSDEFQGYSQTSETQKGYRFSVVDICMEEGLGDVISGQKNILLADSSTEKLAACADATETGYWIMGHKMFSDNFYAWHLTSGGITDTVLSSIGSTHGWNNNTSAWIEGAAQGQMKFNPQGTKLALAIGNFETAIVEIFDFDNSTGSLSNLCHITVDSALGKRAYGLEFSPDGSKLYVGASGGYGGKRIYQYDLTAQDCASIIDSRIEIYRSYANGIMRGMQLAPDGKIYLVCNDYYSLGRINYPDSVGASIGFDSAAVSLPNYNGYTLPSFITGYDYHNTIPVCENCSASPIAKFNFSINGLDVHFTDQSGGLAPNNWFWDFGDGGTSTEQSPTHEYDTAGTYIVSLVACQGFCCDTVIDTITVSAVGIGEIANGIYFNVHPNPATDQLTLQTANPITATYKVYSLTGLLVQSGQYSGQRQSIAIGSWPAGVYLLEVETGDGVLREKFIKR